MLGQYPPTTQEIGFFDVPIAPLCAAYAEWQAPLLARSDRTLEQEPVEGALLDVLRRLLPLTTPICERVLFLETASPWSALVDNRAEGTDVAGDLHHLGGRVLARRTVLAVATPPDQSPESAATSVEFSTESGARRSVTCAKDGARWVFEAFGEPLPFEEPERYRARRIRDRFTPEMAERYLRAVGVEAFSPDFFAPGGRARGRLLSIRGPRPASFREIVPSWASGGAPPAARCPRTALT